MTNDYEAPRAAAADAARAKLIAGLRDAKEGDKYSVSLSGYADAHISVNITDVMLTKARKHTDDGSIDPDVLVELIEEVGYDLTPGICAQCSGWGTPGVSLGLGDDWEINEVRKEKE